MKQYHRPIESPSNFIQYILKYFTTFYPRKKLLHATVKPVAVFDSVEINPPVPPQDSSLNQKLTAAPSGPQVSGTVIQAEDKSPRFTYWLKALLVFTAFPI